MQLKTHKKKLDMKLEEARYELEKIKEIGQEINRDDLIYKRG